VACLATITKYYGGDISIEKFRKYCGTTKQGTTLLGLYQGAQQAGFEAEGTEEDMQELIGHSEPIILHVVIEKNLNHYVVCYGYNGRFLIGDPGWGILHYTENELNAVWKTKKLLELTPNKEFVKEQDINIQKKTWLKQLLKEDIIILGIAVFLGIFMAVMSLAVAVFTQKLIDDYIPSKNVDKLITGLVLLAVILIIKAYLGYVKSFLTIKQSKDFNIRLIHSFFNSILALPKSFFENVKTGELITRINDNQRIQRTVTFLTGSIIVDLLLVFSATIFIFIYSITIGIVVIFSIPLILLLILKYNKRIINAQRAVMNANAACECNYLDAVQGISVIKNMNKESFFTRIIMNSYNNLQESIYRLGRNGNNLGFMTQLISISILISVISTGSFLGLNGFLKTGELIAIIFISSTLTASLISLATANIQLQEAKVAFDRIFEIANSKPEINAIEEQKKQNIDLKYSELTITDLSFRFPGRVNY